MLHVILQKSLLVIVALVIVTVCVFGIGLLMLHWSVNDYANYWRGRANEQGDFLYVALGDSAAQGIGASKPENGYVGRLAANIEQTTGRKVRIINLSRTGATLEDVLRDQAPELATIEPDLVSVEIGANDMKHYNPEQFRQGYERFVQSLPPGKSVIADMPYFGSRPNLNRNARDASRTIHQLGQQYQLPVANLYTSLESRQSPWIYASDLFHPNNRGYRIWEEAFWTAVKPQLVQNIDNQTF
jgi:acyl-CoA thioesterase-1